MSKDDLTYVRHMLDAARKATAFSSGRSRNDLDSDEILALALVRLLEIIGEAARNISQETKQPILESLGNRLWRLGIA